MEFKSRLPIDEYRDRIIAESERHPVLIVTAETGAGKSTRVPFWFWQKGNRVHVTQPRRIAARALCHYVAQSMAVEAGREIGYQTGLDSKKSAATRLLYLTDGVQMVQEIRGRREYDLLVLDEIHEWNLNQEVLIGLVKKNLAGGHYGRGVPRVIIMSATFKARQLAAFLDHAPLISVPGREYPVSRHRHNPCFFIADAVSLIEQDHNLLVFQPGKQEIEEFSLSLRTVLEEDKLKAAILPLHSELSVKEQAKVFNRYPVPKVVVATDIAQTSLTIDDIDAVVDSGLKKEVRVIHGIEGLYPTEISGAECLQRSGRAGRVKPGVYLLLSDTAVEDRPEFPEPEIRRLNLEAVVLRMIKWGLTPLDFVFFHRPKRNLITKAIENLQVFGAIDGEQKITADGRRMADLPLSVRSARLLLEAEKGGDRVVDRALKVIAVLESKGIVNKEFSGGRLYSAPYNSDLLNQLAVWENARPNQAVISGKKLAMAREIYSELKKRLGISRGAMAPLSNRDVGWLFRAILSSFADSVYERNEAGGFRNDTEERAADRQSLFAETRPGMVAGLPFDLVISREDPRTGVKEERCLALLTFCSELAVDQLEDLKPFSFSRRLQVETARGQLTCRDDYHFGGRVIKSVSRPPDWKKPEELQQVLVRAGEWFESNAPKLACWKQLEKNRRWYAEAARLLGNDRPFSFYFKDWLHREMRLHLRVQDLALFFNFFQPLFDLRLNQLLPFPMVRKLILAKWPSHIAVAGSELPLTWSAGRPRITLDRDQFASANRDDLILPTGQPVPIVLENRLFRSWPEAVTAYNDRLKKEIFERRWQPERKPARIADLLGIPFPLAFNGGGGKENAIFEFYTAPALQGDQAVLVHFFTKLEAERYFETIRPEWEAAKDRCRKNSLENIFRDKGWKVK